ncbi:hypothetical protein JCM1840_001824 [Sporobolomyces johnsonii]
MGLSDLFTSSQPLSNVPDPLVPPSAPRQDKDEVVRRLTEELVQTKEARDAAVSKIRELEDVLRLKEGIFDTLERQIENLERENGRLREKEQELEALRLDQTEHPLSDSDLAYRYAQFNDIFSQMRDTLSCAVCYEPYARDQVVSLGCGHSFCSACFSSWEARHLEAFKLSPQQGAYAGPECPECRSTDVRRGRVRIWALEEVVRLVDRATKEIAKPYTPPAPLIPSALDASSSVSSGPGPRVAVTSTPPLPSETPIETAQEAAQPAGWGIPPPTPGSPGVRTGTGGADEAMQIDPAPLAPQADSPVAPEPVSAVDPLRAPAEFPLVPPASLSAEAPAPASANGNDEVLSEGQVAQQASRSADRERHALARAEDEDAALLRAREPDVEDLDPAARQRLEEEEEARRVLRPRTPTPYLAVYR